MRRAFNERQLFERLQQGELTAIVLKDRWASPQSGEPPQTHSQSVQYRSVSGEVVAEVHQYRRANGAIGGSGRPDPKVLRVGPELWRPSHTSRVPCDECRDRYEGAVSNDER